MTIKALQDYTFTAKYANYIPENKRRETWNEAVDRVKNMMFTKYENFDIKEEINWAYELVKQKKVLGSQRTMQFGGEPGLKHEMRNFNCQYSHIDRVSFFQEAMYLLMCGGGVGYSVQKHHIARMPNLISSKQKQEKLFVPEDSIEGWADCIGVLVSSYFDQNIVFPEYTGYRIDFDLTNIRPEGSSIRGITGKAPGPKPLSKALSKIKAKLDICLDNGIFRPVDAHDIVCIASDAVLAGGVRRSALLSLFSPDDEDMLMSKTGNWFYDNPQRARSNNSVRLIRGEFSKKQYQDFFKYTKEYGEPGLSIANSAETGANPCCIKTTKVLTPSGIRNFEDIDVGSLIWSEEGWTKVIKKWSNGIKDVYKYETTSNCFYGTENHKVVSNNIKIEVKDAETLDCLEGPYNNDLILNPVDIMDGLVIGDGSVHKASNNLVYLNIGKDDFDYFSSEISYLIIKNRNGLSENAYEVVSTLNYNELPLLPVREVPERFLYGDTTKVLGFLRGLFSANGSICGKRVTLKTSSPKLREQVQTMLSSVGIRSYFTTNKAKVVEFANGEYECKESYDINISSDRERFERIIGFLQKYKTDKLQTIIKTTNKGKSKDSYEIINVEYLGKEEVFDITVDNETHTYWTQGCNVSNCHEILHFPYLVIDEEKYQKALSEDKIKFGFSCQPEEVGLKTGFQPCNLTTINCKKVKNEDDFIESCKAASFIGTLQAGLNSAPYMGEVTQEIIKREALLGVSMTGVMDNPELILQPNLLKKGAKAVIEANSYLAPLININKCARACTIKPEGTTSCILGTSSGMHPHHYKRYIRRVQANRNENVFKHFYEHNPVATEKSVWSANDTDYVIAFACETNSSARSKNDMSAIELLDVVKTLQINWVNEGVNKDLCVLPDSSHTVSNTINVKPDEWENVSEYIYKNQKYFAGISLLSSSGDKDYPQAPFTAIYLPSQIAQEYGNGSILASGLIERALVAFNNNLWIACDAAMGFGFDYNENLEKLSNYKSEIKSEITDKHDMDIIKKQLYFVDSVKKFANKYMSEDIKKTTYLLKDVYNWKMWSDLQREYKEVDYSTMIEDRDNTNFSNEVACSGANGCEII